jgi:hypothetical protein
MAAARKTKELAVAEVARKALDDAKGDLDEAARMFEEVIRRSPALRDALTEPLISSACRQAVMAEVRIARHVVWHATRHQGSDAPPRAMVTAEEHVRRVVQLGIGTLVMFPLPGGKRLGEATREEIAAAADFYDRQSKDMGAKARWLRLVAQGLPNDARVSDVMTDERLRELQVEAQSDVR